MLSPEVLTLATFLGVVVGSALATWDQRRKRRRRAKKHRTDSIKPDSHL